MERVAWGPPEDGGCVAFDVVVEPMPLPRFLAAVAQVRAAVDAPVQALRPDRVVSPLHIEMAAWHAARAHRDGRGRSDDLAVEFLLYVAGDRQISRAIQAFGVRPETDGRCVLVVLAGVAQDRLDAAIRDAFGAAPAAWPSDHGPDDAVAARAWWVERAGLPPHASLGDAEDAVLAAMADLAVGRL